MSASQREVGRDNKRDAEERELSAEREKVEKRDVLMYVLARSKRTTFCSTCALPSDSRLIARLCIARPPKARPADLRKRPLRGFIL